MMDLERLTLEFCRRAKEVGASPSVRLDADGATLRARKGLTTIAAKITWLELKVSVMRPETLIGTFAMWDRLRD